MRGCPLSAQRQLFRQYQATHDTAEARLQFNRWVLESPVLAVVGQSDGQGTDDWSVGWAAVADSISSEGPIVSACPTAARSRALSARVSASISDRTEPLLSPAVSVHHEPSESRARHRTVSYVEMMIAPQHTSSGPPTLSSRVSAPVALLAGDQKLDSAIPSSSTHRPSFLVAYDTTLRELIHSIIFLYAGAYENDNLDHAKVRLVAAVNDYSARSTRHGMLRCVVHCSNQSRSGRFV